MASLPNNQLVDVEIIQQGIVAAAGSTSKNSVQVYHFHTATNSNNKNKANVATAFTAGIANKLALLLNVRYTGTTITTRWLNDALDSPTNSTWTTVGAIAGDSMTTAVSAYIKLTTGLRGKSYRGSKKLFPMSESDTTLLTDDEWNAACLTRLGTYATVLLAGFTDSDGNVWQPSVVSRLLSQLKKNPTTVTYSLITGTAVRKSLGSMRHRKAKSQY